MEKQNKSIGWVIRMMALAVLYFGWTFLAADYYQNDPSGEGGKTSIWVNSIEQLSNFGSVISYGLNNRFWLFLLVAVLEVAVVILWVVMRRLERELWAK